MYVLSFSNPNAQQTSQSGGKGANLAKLSALGLNVPTGVVVTSGAYEAFIEQATWLKEFASVLNINAPDELTSAAKVIQQRLKSIAVPEAVAQAVKVELEAMATDQGITRVSVRSSATAEDTAVAAFAGQHDTYLNTPLDQVLERLKDCWISLWSGHAIAYRVQAGIGLFDSSMAVVVQAMVQADVAGVAFSVDPIGGDLSKVVVDANFGLGESVVSGEAQVDHWLLEKADGRIVQALLSEKTIKVSSLGDGGVEELEVTEAERNVACLTDAELAQLAQLARTIEKHYGFPQDIEWALKDGTLYVLQSRPITAIAPKWTRDESAERFPNPISPLAWDLVEEGFHQSLNHSFELMGLPQFNGKWFAMFDSYIYGNQNAVELYANGVPLNISSTGELKAMLPIIRAKYGWVQDLPLQWSRDLDWYLLKIGEFKAKDLSSLSLKGLWQHVREVSDTGAQYFLPNIAISITQRVLYKVLHGLLAMVVGPEKAPKVFDTLLANCETKTGAINVQMTGLARIIQALPHVFEGKRSADLVGNMEALRSAAPEFVCGFEKLLAEHGHRELEFDPYVPTWVEAPAVVLDTLQAMARGELHNAKDTERQLKIQAQETLFALQQNIPEDLRYFFTEIVRLAVQYTQLDDLEHYQTTRLTLPLRRALREVGHRLVDLGLIQDPMDVFFARRTTVETAIMTPSAPQWGVLSQEITDNKARHLAALNESPVWQLGVEEEVVAADSSQMTGIPGSPGKVSGPVFIVRSTDDFGDFPVGAVLVARTTNPAWTPLFYSASAVITESGGPLSHGAVTAREMQKPAVMAVRAVMQQLKNGQMVEVDGSRGTVRLLDADAS